MHRIDYICLADCIRGLPDRIGKKRLIRTLCDALKARDSSFNPKKFEDACTKSIKGKEVKK